MRIEAYREEDEIHIQGRAPEGLDRWRWLFGSDRATALLGWSHTALVAARGAVAKDLLVDGQVVQGAELISLPIGDVGVQLEEEVEMGRELLDRLREQGVRVVYAAGASQWPDAVLTRLGFKTPFEFVERTFYLGLGGISRRLDEHGPHPFRRFAEMARRIRQKLIEVEMDNHWLSHLERVMEECTPQPRFCLRRDASYFAFRYRNVPGHQYRLLVLRRQAGTGIDAFAIVETFVPEPGQLGVRLVDHFTRNEDRAGVTWLFGELVMWSLAERASVITGGTGHGTPLDQLFRRTGAIRRAWDAPFWIRALNDEAPPPLEDAELRAGDLLSF
ncbi:MAG: hypothetical protein U1E65_30000 [Myxococcota bacterium]